MEVVGRQVKKMCMWLAKKRAAYVVETLSAGAPHLPTVSLVMSLEDDLPFQGGPSRTYFRKGPSPEPSFFSCLSDLHSCEC